MTDLVQWWALLTALFLFALGGGTWCAWYVRRRVRRLGHAQQQHMDARYLTVADTLAARIDARLEAAGKDIAATMARVSAAEERVEAGLSGLQASMERLSHSVLAMRSEMHAARPAPPAQHPETVDELARINARLRALDRKIDYMGEQVQQAVLAAAIRFTRPGQA